MTLSSFGHCNHCGKLTTYKRLSTLKKNGLTEIPASTKLISRSSEAIVLKYMSIAE